MESEKPDVSISDARELDNDHNPKKDDEHQRLAGYSPLMTIIRLCPGPLISQLVDRFYGVIDSLWVTKFIGEIGLTALSVSFLLENTALAFAFFVSVAVSTQSSYLFSKKEYDKVNQVACDLFRICIIIGCLVPAVLLPIAKPIIGWLDGGDKVVNLAFDYLIPLLSMNVVTLLYHTVCGILQSEGRTWTYGIAQIASLLLNMVCWDPLLLYLTKNTIGSSLSTIIAMLIPTIVLLILLFCGKFATKPSFGLFFTCFIRDTGTALKTGLSALIMNISIAIPSIFMQKFIAIRANKIGQFETIIAVTNANLRLYSLILCIPLALNAAYLPASSYAFGQKNFKRIIHLTAWVTLISIAWGAIVTLLCCIWPGTIGKIWSRDPNFIHWVEIIFPICFYTVILCSVKFIIISFLQATQQSYTAMAVGIVTYLFSLPAFAAAFHYTGRQDNPERVFYSYICNDIFAALVSFLAALPSIIRFYRESRLIKEETNGKDSTSESIIDSL